MEAPTCIYLGSPLEEEYTLEARTYFVQRGRPSKAFYSDCLVLPMTSRCLR